MVKPTAPGALGRPLASVRVVEIAGIGPAPFACMLLADLGADIIRVERHLGPPEDFKIPPPYDVVNRGRASIAIDLKNPVGRDFVLSLVGSAHVLVEGFRPGVAERLGIGPQACQARNPQLVYGRMTGWGQDGPLAHTAGHDINYLALSGALHAIGPVEGPPIVPLNLVGDYGGGALYLAVGIVSALLAVRAGGPGQVVDAAVLDGATSLMTMFYGQLAGGQWRDRRESNLIDGGVPWYACYRTADDRYVAVGALEDRFFAVLCAELGLDARWNVDRHESSNWPRLRACLAEAFAAGTQAHWQSTFERSDACVTPVLDMSEAPAHPHQSARAMFDGARGFHTPGPAPRFADLQGHPTSRAPEGPEPVLETRILQWGVDAHALEMLYASGAAAPFGR